MEYDEVLQPASASLAAQTQMVWSPLPMPAAGADAVALEITAALGEIEAVVAARVAKNNTLVGELNCADAATGAGVQGADQIGGAGIDAAVPR
jgi:hypothetical protein